MFAAHPVVAAAVTEHSDAQTQPWKRAARTISALYTMIFGTGAEAAEVAERVRGYHGSVGGRLDRPEGCFPAGTGYWGLDAELLLWGHVALVRTWLTVYERCVAVLSEFEREAFYDDMKYVAELFCVPSAMIPPTLGDLRDYEREQIASGRVRVTETARRLARVVLVAPLPLPLRGLRIPLRLLALGALPDELRSQYGCRWTRVHEAMLAASADATRRLLPFAPRAARTVMAGPDTAPQLGLAVRLLEALGG
jgi:uncharacterized protein (DUF2236 family)